jgi:hypothetical protein
MPSDIRPPQDDRRLFENLEAKLRANERVAQDAWDELGRHKTGSTSWKQVLARYELHAERARHIRAKLRRGERVPAF